MKYLVEYDIQVFKPAKGTYIEGGMRGKFNTDSEHKITIGRDPKNTIKVPSDANKWSRRQVEVFLRETGDGHEIYARPGNVSGQGTQYGTSFEGNYGGEKIDSGIYCFGDGRRIASGEKFSGAELVIRPNREKNPNRPPANLDGNCDYQVVLKISKAR